MAYKFKLGTYWKWYINYGVILVILGYTNDLRGNKRKGEERKQRYKSESLKDYQQIKHLSEDLMQKQVKNTFMDRFFCNAYIKLIYFILILAQILYFVWEINEVIHPMKANMGKDGCGNVFYRK